MKEHNAVGLFRNILFINFFFFMVSPPKARLFFASNRPQQIVAALTLLAILLLLRAPTIGSSPAYASATTCRANNWSAEYFSNISLQGVPTVSTCETTTPDYNWTGIPVPGVPGDAFSVRWSSVKEFTGGLTTFTTRSDDGVRLYVDGNLIINNWTIHPATTDSATIDLSAGSHNVVLEFFEATGSGIIRLSWIP